MKKFITKNASRFEFSFSSFTLTVNKVRSKSIETGDIICQTLVMKDKVRMLILCRCFQTTRNMFSIALERDESHPSKAKACSCIEIGSPPYQMFLR